VPTLLGNGNGGIADQRGSLCAIKVRFCRTRALAHQNSFCDGGSMRSAQRALNLNSRKALLDSLNDS
jgi:hypothetical protein